MRKYFCDEYTMNEVDTSQYILHSHNDYEIYMFLEGEVAHNCRGMIGLYHS